MLQIKARINISGTTQGATITAVSNLKGNNVSGVVNDVVDKVSVPLGNPFVLGRSVTGIKDVYYDKLPYYMGGQLADEIGNFPEKYVITLTGKTVSNYIIAFDKENDRHPNTVTVDGNVIKDDTAQLELPLDSSKTTHTIEIDNWNTPDYPMIITGLYAVKDLEITQKNLESFSSNIMDRQSEEYPTYGLISNSANLSFYDFDESALDLIITKVLHSGAHVTVWIENEKEAQIHINGEVSGAEETAYMEVTLISGQIDVGNSLFFNGEEATVYEHNEENTYILRCVRFGKFQQNDGNTITVIVNSVSETEQICEMEIRQLSYDNNNRKVDITMKDNLEDMQNINVPAINYDPRYLQSQTAEWYYRKLYDITNNLNKYKILSFDELDDETKNVLTGTVIQYPILESGNLWDSWDKLCQLCLLHMYIDNNNRAVVKYSI